MIQLNVKINKLSYPHRIELDPKHIHNKPSMTLWTHLLQNMIDSNGHQLIDSPTNRDTLNLIANCHNVEIIYG